MGLLCPNILLPASKGKPAFSALVIVAEFAKRCVLLLRITMYLLYLSRIAEPGASPNRVTEF